MHTNLIGSGRVLEVEATGTGGFCTGDEVVVTGSGDDTDGSESDAAVEVDALVSELTLTEAEAFRCFSSLAFFR